jgi:hypothetical protein
MKRFIILLLLFQGTSYGQVNLVANWSMEDITNCPNNAGQLDYAQYWYSPTPADPDYFNACSSVANVPNIGSGYQLAKDGHAFAGIFLWSKFNTCLLYTSDAADD